MKGLFKNILIICEGEKSEPEYFTNIKDKLIDNLVDIYIDIKPKPRILPKEVFELRKGGKRRKIKPIVTEIVTPSIEDKYKAQPTRYVREAQIGLEEGFDEAWAIFDMDGHPNQEEAFKLSKQKIDDKKVNIAFSSISFETWILLHFEKTNTAFQKSVCRNKKEIYYCGSNTHKDDCKGKNCVYGRIVSKGHLIHNGKNKNFEFNGYYDKTNTAIKSAIELRKSYPKNKVIYELNPYTNVDKLVFKLHQLPINYIWAELNIDIKFESLTFNFTKEKTIDITITNNGIARFLLNQNSFSYVKVDGARKNCGSKDVIDFTENNNKAIYTFEPIEGYEYIALTTNSVDYFIIELP